MKKQFQQTKSLADKVAIVTGGGTGIGEAICRKFAREGAKVVVNGLPDDPIDDVLAAILEQDGEAVAFAGDISDEKNAQACVDIAIQRFGKLDVLINNTRVLLVAAKTDDTPVDKFDEHIRCNIRSAFLMTKYALPHLRKSRGNTISADGGIAVGKGSVGSLAKPELTKPPAPTIDLRHSHDGTHNKKIVKIA